MRRVFIPGECLREGSCRLAGSEAHYLLRVLRLGVGDRFVAVLPDGTERVATIESATGEAVTAALGERVAATGDPRAQVRLLVGLPKAAKLELIIQKCTELGVSAVQPVVCRRSVRRPQAEGSGHQLARWERIALEAARQCGRTKPPTIAQLRPLAAALADVAGTGLVLSPAAKAGGPLVEPDCPQPVTVLIGPEGGLTEEEMDEALAAGCRPVSLGPRILRLETAAIAATAIVMRELGELG